MAGKFGQEFGQKIGKSYRETKAELKKVSWPSRKELIQHTEVVVTSIILVGITLAAVDAIFGYGVNLIVMK
jgi:preprotein translocase subunit SecE